MNNKEVHAYITIKFQARNLIDEESLANFDGEGNPITLEDLVAFFNAQGELFEIVDFDKEAVELVKVERMPEEAAK